MALKLLVIVLFIKIVVAEIGLDVNINGNTAEVVHSGIEARALADRDVNTIIGKEKLKRAFIENVRSLGSYHDSDNCGPSERVLSIKSATVKHVNMRPVVVASHVFENFSKSNVTVKTGISHTIENILTTHWSQEYSSALTENVDYGISMGFSLFGFKINGPSYHNGKKMSFSTKGNVNETKAISETIGSTNAVEVKLKPGDAVTAVLSANAGSIEIEVVHQAYLKGNVPIHCDCKIPFGLGVYVNKACEPIETIMASGGIQNNFTTTQTIKFDFYVEGQVKLYEKTK